MPNRLLNLKVNKKIFNSISSGTKSDINVPLRIRDHAVSLPVTEGRTIRIGFEFTATESLNQNAAVSRTEASDRREIRPSP